MSSTGPIRSALESFRRHLAACHAFRAWPDPENVETAEQAAARIYIDAIPKSSTGANHTLAELQALRPFALIFIDERNGLRMRSDSTFSKSPTISGTIICRLECDVPVDLADDPAALALAESTTVGNILRSGDEDEPGLWDLNYEPGFLPLVETNLTGPARTNEDELTELGDALMYELEVHFGT